MLDFGERRKVKRLDVSVPLHYKNLHGADKVVKGTLTRDFGEGGVKFVTDKFLSLACRMVVEVDIPSADKPIRAISKVAWIKKLASGSDYEIGNQFLDMTKEDKALISSYVKKLAESSLAQPEF